MIVTLYKRPHRLQPTKLLIYTSWLCIPSILDIKTQQDIELGNKFKFISWSCGTKRMDFGFHETFVKMAKPCLEDEVIVRLFFFFTVTQSDSLFCRLFEVWQDFWCCDSEVGFLWGISLHKQPVPHPLRHNCNRVWDSLVSHNSPQGFCKPHSLSTV